MPLGVPLEVGPGELERVEQRVGGGELDLVTGLVSPHAVNNRSQDLVRRLLHEQGVHVLGETVIKSIACYVLGSTRYVRVRI